MTGTPLALSAKTRLRDDEPGPEPRKRQKTQSLILDLPTEVFALIVQHLDCKNLRLMSEVSRQFHQVSVPFLMSRIRVSWDQLIAWHKGSEPLFRYRDFVQTMTISPANSYNEYQMDTFGQLLSPERFPHLRQVLVNSNNSSYWLKYNKCSHIHQLSLYSDNPAAGVKTFHLSHADRFSGLTEIVLHDYHFNWTEEEERGSLLALKSLKLHNCTWEYPFGLASFNMRNSLRELVLTYTSNNAFILLERFLNFLADPFSNHLDSLESLTIGFISVTPQKRLLTLQILASLLLAFPSLSHLHLSGWSANLNDLAQFLQNQHLSTPLHLLLHVEAEDTMTHEVFSQRIAGTRNLRLSISRA